MKFHIDPKLTNKIYHPILYSSHLYYSSFMFHSAATKLENKVINLILARNIKLVCTLDNWAKESPRRGPKGKGCSLISRMKINPS